MLVSITCHRVSKRQSNTYQVQVRSCRTHRNPPHVFSASKMERRRGRSSIVCAVFLVHLYVSHESRSKQLQNNFHGTVKMETAGWLPSRIPKYKIIQNISVKISCAALQLQVTGVLQAYVMSRELSIVPPENVRAHSQRTRKTSGRGRSENKSSTTSRGTARGSGTLD